MPLICAICGKNISNVARTKNICLDCFISEGLYHAIDRLELTLCPSCYSIKNVNWKKVKTMEDINSYIEAYLVKKIKTREGVYIKSLSFSTSEDFSHGIAHMNFYLKDYDRYIDVETKVELKINKKLCSDCLNVKTENYSAILQIRDPNLLLINEMEKDIEDMLSASNEIIKHERFSYGSDIYFLHTNTARRVARILAKKYFCKYEETFSIKSRNKHIYTILLVLRD